MERRFFFSLFRTHGVFPSFDERWDFLLPRDQTVSRVRSRISPCGE